MLKEKMYTIDDIYALPSGKRAELIQKFQAEGITEINGKPLGQFIKVGKTI